MTSIRVRLGALLSRRLLLLYSPLRLSPWVLSVRYGSAHKHQRTFRPSVPVRTSTPWLIYPESVSMALLGANSRPSTDLRSAPNAVGGFAGHCVRGGERCDARPVGSGDDATAAPVSALPVGIFTGAS